MKFNSVLTLFAQLSILACVSLEVKDQNLIVINQADKRQMQENHCKFLGVLNPRTPASYGRIGRSGNLQRLKAEVAQKGGNVLLTGFEDSAFETARGEAYHCPASSMPHLKDIQWHPSPNSTSHF